MLNKIVMNCLVGGYLGRIFFVVHGVDLRLWRMNVWCAGIEEINMLCILGIFMIYAWLRGKMVKCATFDRIFRSWPPHGLIFSLAGRGPIATKFCTIII